MHEVEADGQREEVAIIGLAGRFPGAADVETFWKNLLEGKESIRPFTEEELRSSGIDPLMLKNPGYVNSGAVLEAADQFDADFFGFSPREAEITDPQHRIFLECAWTALESAGYDSARFEGSIGIFGGVARNSYLLQNLVRRPDILATVTAHQAIIGNDKDFPVTRAAFKMNLRGPCINVQTACSTSGVAVHLAAQSLLAGECDLVLAGGARVRVPLQAGYEYEEGGIQSPDGHCRAFDAQAGGTVVASGVAMLVLKRLSEAVRDHDTIYAIIKGSAVNNDGSAKIGFTAPSVEGQARVIAEAQAVAGVSAESIGYIETHGTGTSLGDPIEIAALTRAFARSTDRKQFVPIGSLKTNIGHLDAGAGAAGVMKAALALKNRQIPPSLNFTKPNPQIDFANSPFFVNTSKRDWISEGPRRAGVSSFGMGGTNFHVVLEEAPELPSLSTSVSAHLLVLSARTPTALQKRAQNLADYLRQNPSTPLADVAWTLQVGRREMDYRVAVAGRTHAELIQKLETVRPADAVKCVQQNPEVCFLFTGQGSQRLQMGRELFEQEPVFRKTLQDCSEILEAHLGGKLTDWLYPCISGEDAEARLKQTAIAQPALFVMEYALACLWMDRGVKPLAMIGHSIGEYVAATVAGVFKLPDALKLVALRGRLMQRMEPGTMVAVRQSEAACRQVLIPGLDLAAVNSAELCVVSGPTSLVESWATTLNQQGIVTRVLQTSHAFHSAMMEPMLLEFEKAVGEFKLDSPRLKFVSNVTGEWILPEEACSPRYWSQHLRQTVRFADGVGQVFRNSQPVMLEIGPGRTLATLAGQHPQKPSSVLIVPSLPQSGEGHDDVDFAQSAGRLWAAGVSLNWRAVQHFESRGRVALPTYPFERKRFWVQPPTEAGLATSATVDRSQFNAVEASSAEKAIKPVMDVPERLCALLRTMSGLSSEQLRLDAGFLELGFDSLFLTQARHAIEKEFKVPVTFRQLLEELSTPQKVIDYLEEKGAGSRAPLSNGKSGAMKGAGASRPVRGQDAPAPLMGITKSEAGLPGAECPDSHPVTAQTKEKDFGPFRPPEKTKAQDLTPAQLQFVADFVQRYTQRTGKSKELTQRFRKTLADPRAVSGFKSLWKEAVYPIYSAKSEGARVWDVDGNEYIDVTLGFGLTLLGHQPPFVMEALKEQMQHGFEIGPSSILAGEVAELVSEMTGLERVTFCNTGSEAVLAALRVARTVTGRQRVAVFSGGYHGIFDEVLVRRQKSDGRTVPIAPGIPPNMVENILVLEYGSPEALQQLRECAGELAAVLVEPVQSRNPDLQPREFLHELRRITKESGAALILDEMITGFRVHPRGAQGWFGIEADIATYGKVIGGGMPLGIVAGKAAFMDALDGGPWQFGDDSYPSVGVTFFAGTFVRHPLALAAARAVLQHLKTQGGALQEELNRNSSTLFGGLNRFFAQSGAGVHIAHFGSMFLVQFNPQIKYGNLLYFLLREKGILIREGRPNFLCCAHTQADLAHIAQAFRESVIDLQNARFLPSDVGSGARTLPLTAAQEELWLGAQLSEDAQRSFNDTVLLHLDGNLEVEKLQAALHILASRHDALRTSFDSEQAEQRILPAVEISLEVESLEYLNQQQQTQTLSVLAARANAGAFNLSQAPLLRATLVRLADHRHVLVMTTNHLVIDGWSMAVLIRELGQAYAGQPLASALQFESWAEWQKTAEVKAHQKESLQYWIKKFQQPPPPLELPQDYPRSLSKQFAARRESLMVQSETLHKLRSTASRENTTLVVFLLASFAQWLGRISGEKDVVIGLPVAGQPGVIGKLEGAASLVGHCVHLLPIRLQVSPDESFRAALAATRREVLDSFECSDITFGTLVQQLNLPRDPSRTPLTSITFNLDRAMDNIEFGELKSCLEIPAKTFNFFDLSLNLIEFENALRIDCRYNSSLWEGATIQRWLQGWATLLEGVIADPGQIMGDASILHPKERALLAEWCRGPFAPVAESSLIERFLEASHRNPDKVAIVSQDTEWTYRKLEKRARAIAGRLRQAGVNSEKLVAVYQERTPDLVASLLGILWAGGAYLPLDPKYPAERNRLIVEDARPVVLLSQLNLKASVGPLMQTEGRPQIIMLEELFTGPEGGEQPIVTNGGSSILAYVIYTSGSTGRPKGVAIEQRNVAALLESARLTFQPNDWDGVLFSTSICFDISVFEVFGTLCHGGTLILADNALQLPELTAAERVTLINTVPSAMQELVNMQAVPKSVRVITLIGEALPTPLVDQLYELPGMERVYDLYGPTETTVYSTGIIRKSGVQATIGKPIANTQVRILDERLQQVPVGAVGELYIGGAGVARGYLNRPELTAERFVTVGMEKPERHYRTGDLVRFRGDGNLEFLGRVDHQVKIRGHRIELGEIEARLAEHSSVLEGAVIAHAEDGEGLSLVAGVALHEGQNTTPSEIRRHLLEHLPDFMVPTRISILERLPRNANGKVDRRALASMVAQAPRAHQVGPIEPRSPVEAFIMGLWEELLKRSPGTIGLEDNFFELGGHSLLLTRLLARVRREVQVDLPLRDVFKAPTIASLAELIEAEMLRQPAEPASSDPHDLAART